MKTYNEILDYLYNKLPYYQRAGKIAYKADLNNSIKIDDYFGNPHKKYKSIHIAGTNGKGSVSHMIASVLQSAGYKVGLYTSPHLKDFRERIKINGEEIPKEEIISFVKDNIAFFNEIQPSFFEITVAMAFYYFAKENVDFAVVEVGLGGRLDSTNIITPVFSVITNISLDHTELLGNTKELIAKEKAGIIKNNVPVIIGQIDPIVDKVFEDKAKLNKSDIYFADKMHSVEYSMLSIDNKQVIQVLKNGEIIYPNIKTDLLGVYQVKNIITTIASIELLKSKSINIDKSAIYNGLENVVKITGIQGRWEILGANPRIVCDTAHNEEGLKQVVNQIKNTPYKKLHMVMGFVEGKDLDSILKLLPQDATYYFTKAQIPRALNEEKLHNLAANCELKGEMYKSVIEGLNAAKSNAQPEDFIFIGGSTFIVAEVI
ncbi:bifunctional folylpolyglutamate synthase/dihydrofolate synthase [Bacteroidota bacterium]